MVVEGTGGSRPDICQNHNLIAKLWTINVFFFIISEVFSNFIMSTYYVKNQGEKKLPQSQDLNLGQELYIIHIIPHMCFNTL